MRHVMLVIDQFRPCTYSSLVGPRTTSDGPLVISFVFRLAFVKIKTSVQAAFCSNWISSVGNCCLDNQPDYNTARACKSQMHQLYNRDTVPDPKPFWKAT